MVKKTGAPKKLISTEEYEFARLMIDEDLSPGDAARKVFGWRCEPRSRQTDKARTLAKSPRVQKAMAELTSKAVRKSRAANIVAPRGSSIEKFREFAFERLEQIRDDTANKAVVRLQAIKSLEKLHDPSSDSNLIMKWVSLSWLYMNAHCPCCHHSFPLELIENVVLKKWRDKFASEENFEVLDSSTERRLRLLKKADRRKTPHAGQLKALSAPERNIIGLGSARGGKSLLMAYFAILGLLLPGVEIWVLARIYEDAKSEVEYLKNFIKGLFYPHENLVMKIYEDRKNGELHLYTKWGSVLKIRSAKSKGSITGRELEMALVAEPGWVPDDIYEELRARMSSRLGRIIAFGTPKGSTGFIHRMIKMTGRDPKTNRIIRTPPQQRLISAGCNWNTSMLLYTMNPRDNPEYVQSELDAARQELTDVEYASEFKGEIVNIEGLKFPGVSERHLSQVSPDFFQDAVFVLGIDQGPTNFAAVLTAWNGESAVVCHEFFDGSERTMKANLKYLLHRVPYWVQGLMGAKSSWGVTITDKHPQVYQIINELSSEGHVWPTEIIERHINNRRAGEHWRRETTEWINNLARRRDTATGDFCLRFHIAEEEAFNELEAPGAVLLHEQVRDALDKKENFEKESGSSGESLDKGWIIRDKWRGDHNPDAWMFCMWSILTGQLLVGEKRPDIHTPYIEEQKAMEYELARQENDELGLRSGPDELFKKSFGRPGPKHYRVPIGWGGYGDGES